MKLAIFFCFIAFGYVAQAQLLGNLGSNIGGWLSNSANLLSAAKDKLEETKVSVNEQISMAVDSVKVKIIEPKKQAEELIEKLKDSANSISNGVTEKVEKTLDEVNKQVDEITKEADDKEIDVSECKSLTKKLKKVALKVVTNTSSCVTDKIDEGKSLLENIIANSKSVITEVMDLKVKYDECFNDIEGIIAKTTASACISGAGMKATWALSKSVPAVASDISTITNLISNLQTTLPICMSTNLLTSLQVEAKDVLKNVKECVAEKLTSSKSS